MIFKNLDDYEELSYDDEDEEKGPALEIYGTDLTLLAQQGQLEECFGREKELLELMEILVRRQKNNPVLVGDAGVGKTAIIDFCNFIDIPTNFFDAVKGESDTVAGLILELAGEFPTVQQVVKYKQFSFTALDIQKNRIHKVQSIITPITTISQENV